MAYNFLRGDRDQPFLLPPDLRDWLPEGHLAWFILDVVDQLDLDAFLRVHRADGHGHPAYDPKLLLGVLLYGYCLGIRSSRQLERRCTEDIAFRVLAANQTPDHVTIARFRVRHEQALAGFLVASLKLCATAGMVRVGTVALDGTKLAGNAADKANRTLDKLEAEVTEILRTIDFAGFAEIAREVGAILVADIAHVADWWPGAHPSPVDHAEVISTTTHKTLRGPRGAMLLCGSEQAQALDRAVFPGLQGRPARPHHRGDRGGAARGRAAGVPRLRETGRRQRQAAGGGARRARLRPGLRWHRQPPAADRPDRQRSRGQAGRAGPGPCWAGHQLQHRPLRPAQAVQPVRHPAWDPFGDQPRDGAGGDGADGPLDRRGVQAVKAKDEATLDRIAAEVAELATRFPPPGIPVDSL
jgi:transposase